MRCVFIPFLLISLFFAQASVQAAVQGDTCETARTILRPNLLLSGSTEGAVNNYQLISGSACFTGVGQSATTAPGPDVVFIFQANGSADYSILLRSASLMPDAVLYVSSTCP